MLPMAREEIELLPFVTRLAEERAGRISEAGLTLDLRGDKGAGKYADVAGFCMSAKLEKIRKHGHVLTPGRYVGAEAVDDDDEGFEAKMQALTEKLGEQMAKGAELDLVIRQKLGGLGYEF